jgi:H+/Cl- antiporter ClcA
MHRQPDFLKNLQNELANGRLWVDRSIVLAYAIAAGLSVVAFTLLADWAFVQFERIFHWQGGWAVLLWIPACTAAIVWATRRFAPGAAGSGIPQVMAALDPAVDATQRSRFVSLRLTVAKIVLGGAGFLAGLSIGREGPSVQVAAGVMQHARRWLGPLGHHGPRRCWWPAALPALRPPSMRRWPGWCLPSRSCRASSNRAAAA